MVDRSQRPQCFRIARLVSNIADFACEVRAVGFGNRGIDVVLRRRDDGYVCAVFEQC